MLANKQLPTQKTAGIAMHLPMKVAAAADRDIAQTHALLRSRRSMAPIDLQEYDTCYLAFIYAETHSHDDTVIIVKDGLLTIKSTQYADDKSWHRDASLGFLLPADANGEAVYTCQEDGIMKIIIYKR